MQVVEFNHRRCWYKSHFELEVLSKFCTFYWMCRQGVLCIRGLLLRSKDSDRHIWNRKYCTHLDIFFGIWTNVLVYRYILIFPKPTIFLVPFYNAGFAELNFFPSALIWSNQNIFRLQGTLTNVNSCTLYLYQYYQALCLYCFRYITKKDKGRLDLLF